MRDTPDPSTLNTLVCPRCHSNKLVYLKSMRRHDSREWYKCDGCEHIVTVAKPVSEVAQGAPGQAVA
jgi:DNA-directed RNA polymerase subunit M/transcription elongation factor TFIIS